MMMINVLILRSVFLGLGGRRFSKALNSTQTAMIYLSTEDSTLLFDERTALHWVSASAP